MPWNKGDVFVRIHYLQNDKLCALGNIESWAKERGHSITSTHLDEEACFPSLEDFDLLIISGGRMTSYEEDVYPWLAKEKDFIREATSQQKFLLGICLGAQLIADSLGGKVYPHKHKEIGWWPIELTEEGAQSPLLKGWNARFPAFLFHWDTFDLPEGAVRLCTSDGCANQAFQYGERVIGVQFHPELTNDVISMVGKLFEHVIGEGPYIQKTSYFRNQTELVKRGKALMYTLLDNIEKSFIEHE
jgi:GMP synthase-like glutamine amidotransferase